MDLTKLKEPLGIEDIDFRVQSINKRGYATILAYKDARVDMNRLDEVVGQENWQRDHKEIKNVVYCGIGIDIGEQYTNEKNQDAIFIKSKWVWKWDAGVESFTEKQKGEASDSFKRSGFNWGIGRELYDYPQITVQLRADAYYTNHKNYFIYCDECFCWIHLQKWTDKDGHSHSIRSERLIVL